jgi:hypothetical protein
MYELQPLPPQHTPSTPQARPRNRFGAGMVSGALAFVTLAALAAALAVLGYALIARDLPSPSELRQRASTFQSHAHLRPRGQPAQRSVRPQHRPPHRGQTLANISPDT